MKLPSHGSMLRLLAATLALGAGAAAQALTVFSDGFEDGLADGWSVWASAGVTQPVVSVRSDTSHSGQFALWTFFDAPGGGTGANFVRASHDFIAPGAGSYLLDLWGRSAGCGGCTMYFDVLVDGELLTRDGSAPDGFKQATFPLPALSAGSHTLTLGMYTDAASSGRFQASFDDVSITSSVPELPPLALLSGGLLGIGLLRRWRQG